MESIIPYDIQEDIPDSVQEAILLRLPLKSLLACIFVCKKWKTMIYDKKFKDDYLLSSMTRPMDPTPDSLFHSFCQQPQMYEVTAPIRGVVCLRTLTRFFLCNPITNNFLPLPVIEGRTIVYYLSFFFGYDEATGVFKVIWQNETDQHLVYTVGGDGSWRAIACDRPHFKVTSAMCKGGVLYYAALTHPDHAPTIMSFNVSSEAFEVFALPEGVILRDDATMVNYDGKVALVNNKSETGEFEICVRNEVSGQWELQQLVIPGWRDNIVGNDMMFSFVGTIGTGELVFTAPASGVDGPVSVLHYNTNPPQGREIFEMSRIEADNGGSYHYVRACLNHFESLLRTN